jgi:tight adherence protein B
MIPLLLSLAFGFGILFLYMGLTARPGERDAARETTLARALRRAGGRREVEEFLVRAGLRGVSPRDFALFSICSGVACGACAQLFLGWGLVSALAFLLGMALPVAYYVRRHDRRRADLQAALADAVAQLRDAMRSGLAMQDAFAGLARTGPEALRPEFERLVGEAQVRGFRQALERMKERLADPLFDVVCAALVMGDELGGRNIGQVLGQLVEATRGQQQVQEELRAQQARNVLSARIVAAVPVVLLAAMRTLNPRYVAVFDTWTGQLVLAGCAASIVLGYLAMVWTTRLPDDRRVLA